MESVALVKNINNFVAAGNTKSAIDLLNAQIAANSRAIESMNGMEGSREAVSILQKRNALLIQTNSNIRNGKYDAETEKAKINDMAAKSAEKFVSKNADKIGGAIKESLSENDNMAITE
jgi:hypothetical protein